MQGSYILVILVDDELNIPIAKLGNLIFKKGIYCYIGSAMGKIGSSTLENRIKRHIRFPQQKNKHWHIDYLLENKKVSLFKLFLIPHTQKLECMLAQEFLSISDGYVERFGSSDCLCKSHLTYFTHLGYNLLKEFIQ